MSRWVGRFGSLLVGGLLLAVVGSPARAQQASPTTVVVYRTTFDEWGAPPDVYQSLGVSGSDPILGVCVDYYAGPVTMAESLFVHVLGAEGFLGAGAEIPEGTDLGVWTPQAEFPGSLPASLPVFWTFDGVGVPAWFMLLLEPSPSGGVASVCVVYPGDAFDPGSIGSGEAGWASNGEGFFSGLRVEVVDDAPPQPAVWYGTRIMPDPNTGFGRLEAPFFLSNPETSPETSEGDQEGAPPPEGPTETEVPEEPSVTDVPEKPSAPTVPAGQPEQPAEEGGLPPLLLAVLALLALSCVGGAAVAVRRIRRQQPGPFEDEDEELPFGGPLPEDSRPDVVDPPLLDPVPGPRRQQPGPFEDEDEELPFGGPLPEDSRPDVVDPPVLFNSPYRVHNAKRVKGDFPGLTFDANGNLTAVLLPFPEEPSTSSEKGEPSYSDGQPDESDRPPYDDEMSFYALLVAPPAGGIDEVSIKSLVLRRSVEFPPRPTRELPPSTEKGQPSYSDDQSDENDFFTDTQDLRFVFVTQSRLLTSYQSDRPGDDTVILRQGDRITFFYSNVEVPPRPVEEVFGEDPIGKLIDDAYDEITISKLTTRSRYRIPPSPLT